MKLERFPLGAPELQLLPGTPKYPFRLLSDFVYCWPGDDEFGPEDIVCPATYETDLLSVPRWLWWILPPQGPGCWGALPHDILCSTEWGKPGESVGTRVRRDNRILRQAALDSGAPKWRVDLLFAGVEVGCKATWNVHVPSEVTDDLILMSQGFERWSMRKGVPAG